MEQKQDDRYTVPDSFIDEQHEKNKKRVRRSGIVLIALPVVLGLIRWLTDSDKTVFLIIWVIFMFLIAAYLVSIEYFDHVLFGRIKKLLNSESEQSSLLDGEKFIPSPVREGIRNRLTSDAADDAEEGGRQ